MHHWPQKVIDAIKLDGCCVVVTVTDVKGSAPREPGSKLWVSASMHGGTIGGGYLEHTCQENARAALAEDRPRFDRQRYTLGSDCGQCCGGVVDIMMQRLNAEDLAWLGTLVEAQRHGQHKELVTYSDGRTDIQDHGNDQRPDSGTRTVSKTGERAFVEIITPPPIEIAIFGAGHVARACAAVMGTLDARILMIDSRESWLAYDWPEAVSAVYAARPELMVEHLSPTAQCLIMTHDHAVDLDICHALLTDDAPRFCGLIGSRSKQRRFVKKLKALGHNDTTLARLTCPIGTPEISGKQPGEIAISVAADMLQRLGAMNNRNRVLRAVR
ncbi:MAG: xanthine dehydrogenase accessory protein XdhC [Pseudomonadota bacterium]